MHWGKFVVHHLVQRYFDLQTRGSSLLLPDMGNMRNVQIGEGCAAYWTEHTGFWKSIACSLYVRCYLIISTLCLHWMDLIVNKYIQPTMTVVVWECNFF